MADDTIPPPGSSSRAPRVALVFGALFFFAPLVALGLGVRASAIENRELAARPGLDAGWDFFPQMTAWATDHLPLRDHAVRWNDSAIEAIFHQPPGVGGTGGPLGGSNVTPVDLYPKVIQGSDDWLYYGIDVSVPCLATRPVADTVAELRRLREAVEATGATFVFVVAPNKTTMVPEHLPDHYAGEECAAQRTAEMRQALDKEAGGAAWFLDLRQPLLDLQATDGEPLYRRRDTHWSMRGGSVFGQELFARLDPGLTSYADLVKIGSTTRQGDLAGLLGRRESDRFDVWSLDRPGVTLDYATAADYDSLPEPTSTPVHLTARTTGARLFTPSTLLLGDSFTAAARPVLYPLFSDLTLLHGSSSTGRPQVIADAVANADVVVVEVVERDLMDDAVPILSPSITSAIEARGR